MRAHVFFLQLFRRLGGAVVLKHVVPDDRRHQRTMRVELVGYFKPCMTEIYIHIDAREADYIHTHP